MFISTHDSQDAYDAPDIANLPADEWLDVSSCRELVIHAKWATSGAGAIADLSLFGTNFDDKSGELQLTRASGITGTGSTSAAFAWR